MARARKRHVLAVDQGATCDHRGAEWAARLLHCGCNGRALAGARPCEAEGSVSSGGAPPAQRRRGATKARPKGLRPVVISRSSAVPEVDRAYTVTLSAFAPECVTKRVRSPAPPTTL